MSSLAILADDLTGAADCGLQATRHGLRTVVAFGAPGAGDPADADVVAWDLDTRGRDADEAYAETLAAARAVALDDHVYLKIDSTLRGHIGASIDAALEGTGTRVAIVAPAFPALGRTTLGGRHIVSAALAWPEGSSDLLGLLRTQSRHEVEHLGLDELRAGGAPTALGRLAAGGILACDSEDEADLSRLAAELLAAGERVLWVGSAGLADALARELTDRTPEAPAASPTAGAVLTVCGSIAASCRAQMRALLEQDGVVGVAADPSSLARGGECAAAEVGRASAALRAALDGGHDAVLHVPADEATLAAVQGLEQEGAGSMQTLGGRIAEGLAKIVAAAEPPLGGLVLTGGETARAVCDALGISGMELYAEVETGVPAGRAVGRDFNVVTKAGAFGEAESLVRARQTLKAPAPRPLIAITMGDAAGIGPEIIVKALADPAVHELCDHVVIGDAAHLRRAQRITGADVEIAVVGDPREPAGPGVVKVLDMRALPEDLPFGELSDAAGEAAYRYVERAARLALDGAVDAICTAPLNKEALHLAGRMYPGHTELLAELTGSEDYAMMLTTPSLRVIHVTTHVGLLDAIERIDPPRVERVVRLGHEALRAAGIEHPRIAVCGINPHAGEGGLFGRGEEAEKIEPALEKLRAEGIDAQGPLPADTVFFRAVRGDFDLAVAMYHDQGHGPVKVLGLDEGVNVTVGLPVVRTSVDHGTAFDIAGTGRAEASSLKAALREAARLAPAVRRAR